MLGEQRLRSTTHLKNAPPVVAIDARMVGPVGHGIARYVEDLLLGLASLSQRSYQVKVLCQPAEVHSEKWQGFQAISVHASFLSPLELFEVPFTLLKEKIALFHSPSFSSYPLLPCPWVVTLHDLNHLTYGSPLKKLYYKTVTKPFAKHAKKVLSVSHESAREIAAWLEVPIETVQVAYNAIHLASESLSWDSSLSQRFGIESQKYFLALSHHKPHKNLQMLLRAYQEAKTSWPLLITAEGSNFSTKEGGKVIFAPGLGDQDVENLLQHCGALCFPSLYEGFGRPPVEALLRGRPALLSDIPVHREILGFAKEGEGAVFLNPQSVSAWTQALSIPPPHVNETIQKEIQGRYSVESLANTMDRVYRDVLRLKE